MSLLQMDCIGTAMSICQTLREKTLTGILPIASRALHLLLSHYLFLAPVNSPGTRAAAGGCLCWVHLDAAKLVPGERNIKEHRQGRGMGFPSGT